ncbi:MAG: anaerobic sulfatase maturase [Lachnospiraceae bacterium]|nr:anaerobic sulfatase maturase [Lachnospiraceae bacterium]
MEKVMENEKQEARQPFVVMAKPVGSLCNMHCSYCYYLDKGKYSAHSRQVRMNVKLLEKLICQTIEASPGPVVSFTWHGGEPTLAGLDFYQYAVDLERKYLPGGWQVWNNLQTNGLLLNERWCRFLKENHFDVGLSIDGTQAVHDQNRKDLGGQETYDRVRQSVERLQAVEIEPDLLCTVNSATVQDALGVYRTLRELNTGWIQFIPIVVRCPDGNLSPESVCAEDYGDFLCTIFDEWVTNDLGQTDVQLFAETARIMAGGEASLCWMAPSCGRVLIAEEDGSLYSCDHFVDDKHRIGNLKRNRIEEAADSAFQVHFGNAKRDSLTAKCRACQWLKYCNGGCLKDRFGVTEDGEKGQYVLCAGLERFFAYACPVLEQVMQLSRQGKRPRQIMNAVRKNFH